MLTAGLDALDAARRARAQIARELAKHLAEAADLGLSRDVLRLLLRLRRIPKAEARRELRVMLSAAADLSILDPADLDDMLESLGLAEGELPAPPDEPPEPAKRKRKPVVEMPNDQKPNGHALEEAEALA